MAGTAYAFTISRIDTNLIALKVWILARASFVSKIQIEQIPELIRQIDSAIANDELCITIGDHTFNANAKLLQDIRKNFVSYISCNRVGSDGQVGSGDVSTSSKNKSSASVSVRKRNLSEGSKTVVQNTPCAEKSAQGNNSHARKSRNLHPRFPRKYSVVQQLNHIAKSRVSNRNGRTSVIVAHETLTSNKGK